MTILEMLDALEAELAALRAPKLAPGAEARAAGIETLRNVLARERQNGRAHREPPPSISNEEGLGDLMKQAGLSQAEFGSVFGVHVRVIEHWLNGSEPPPAWVPVTVRTLALLDPVERRKLLGITRPRAPQPSRRTHPFSRIEEL